MREIQTVSYNSERFTDENVLYKNRLIDPVTLSRGLTYLYGKDSDMFPLLQLTDGQKGVVSLTPKALNDSQYTWNVMGRMKFTSVIVGLANGNNVKPGLGAGTFEVDFEDNWFVYMSTITTPDKQHQLRVEKEPAHLGANRYRYTFMLLTGNPDEFVDLGNFAPGLAWTGGAPSVAPNRSRGTSSNSMTPGKMTNQFGLYRFSKAITGNVANKVTNIEFDTVDGGGNKGKTNLWMPFEMKQFEFQRRVMLEEELWNSKYNRDAHGNIMNKDSKTGEPIPRGAGVKDVLFTTGQYETYSKLTIAKIDSVINKLYTNRVDTSGPLELVFMGGTGAMRMLNSAIKSDALSKGYYEALGKEEVKSGKDGYLSYGAYFNQYKTVDGHIFTVKSSRIFDQGTYAQMDRKNGRMFDGLPYESYNLFLLDMSRTNDGERNVELVAEKGREILTGVYKGMTNLPTEWAAMGNDKFLSTTEDVASYEVMVSQGIAIRNFTTSYWFQFEM